MTMTADEMPIYNAVPGYETLRKTLDAKLAEYNESNTVMDLVLFQQVLLWPASANACAEGVLIVQFLKLGA